MKFIAQQTQIKMSNQENDLNKLVYDITKYDLDNLFTLSVSITSKHGKPAVEIRKLITDEETIKKLIWAAYHRRPLIFMPAFPDLLQSIANCIEKGILYKDEAGQYRFTF